MATTSDFLNELFKVLVVYTSGTLFVATIIALVESRKAN